MSGSDSDEMMMFNGSPSVSVVYCGTMGALSVNEAHTGDANVRLGTALH